MKTSSVTLLLGISAYLAIVGCNRGEAPIVSYTVPREHFATEVPGATAPDRTLAVLVPLEQQAWFLKAAGPKQQVDAMADEFRSLVESLRKEPSSDNLPLSWKLPEGWRQEDGGTMRIATLRIEDAPDVDVSVSSLPMGSGSLDSYVLANVNRWRGQMSLPPIRSDQLFDTVETLAVGDLSVMWVDISGTLQGSASSMQGMAQGAAAAEAHGAASRSAASTIEANVPDEWQPGQLTSMRQAAYRVADGQRQVEITVIALGPEAGDILDNVNRWREQVGLAPLDAGALDAAGESLNIADHSAFYIELENPEAKAGQHQAVYGVILPDSGTIQGRIWFVKMSGDLELARQQRDNFRRYAQSLRFPSSEPRE